MRKLNAILTLPVALGLLAGTAIAAEKSKGVDDKTPAKRLEVGPENDPKAAILPEHRRAKVNMQSQGRPPVVPLPTNVGPQGDSVFAQGVLEDIIDGALVIRFRGNLTDPPNKKAVKWYRVADMNRRALEQIAKKKGQIVRLELKRDANNQPYVMNLLPPR